MITDGCCMLDRLKIQMTDALRSEIEKVRNSGTADLALCERTIASDTISLSQLREICRFIPQKNILKDLLVGSSLVFKKNDNDEVSLLFRN